MEFHNIIAHFTNIADVAKTVEFSKIQIAVGYLTHRDEAELRAACDTTRSVKMNEDSESRREKTSPTIKRQNQQRKKINQAVTKPKISKKTLFKSNFSQQKFLRTPFSQCIQKLFSRIKRR